MALQLGKGLDGCQVSGAGCQVPGAGWQFQMLGDLGVSTIFVSGLQLAVHSILRHLTPGTRHPFT